MLKVDFIVNSVFNSITYILSAGSKDCWLVDCGDVEKVLDDGWWVKGVLLTHVHYDHIYGLNKLVEAFPEAVVYTNADGQKGLQNPRWNFSHFHEVGDFEFDRLENVRVVREGDVVSLFDGSACSVIESPGHDPSCLAFRIGDVLYTGDAYIPGVKVVTSFPRSNKRQAAESLARLQQLEVSGLKVMPGHWMGNFHLP